MQFYVTRDSVALGDDIDAPHKRTISVPDGLSPLQIIAQIADGYLARVQGGATWSVCSGRPLAVVAQRWPEPRLIKGHFLKLEHFERSWGKYRVHFNYHMQQDPDVVLSVLERLSLHAL